MRPFWQSQLWMAKMAEWAHITEGRKLYKCNCESCSWESTVNMLSIARTCQSRRPFFCWLGPTRFTDTIPSVAPHTCSHIVWGHQFRYQLFSSAGLTRPKAISPSSCRCPFLNLVCSCCHYEDSPASLFSHFTSSVLMNTYFFLFVFRNSHDNL